MLQTHHIKAWAQLIAGRHPERTRRTSNASCRHHVIAVSCPHCHNKPNQRKQT